MLNTNNLKQQANAYRDITQQFVIDASFLWLLRSISVKQPHFYLDDLTTLENRVNANLDGAMCDFESAWDICLEELVYEQAGETFTAAMIAFRSRDMSKIKHIVEHAFCNEQTFEGSVSAIAWLPKQLNKEWLEKFLVSKDLNHKHLAIAVCSALRKNPSKVLFELFEREDCVAHTPLLARMIRLVGELKLYAFANHLQKHTAHALPEVQFWANWSLVMLGEHKQVLNLIPFIQQQTPFQHQAIEMAFKILPIANSRAWISQHVQKPEMLRVIIRSTGVLGDTHAIPWLIEKMKNFETAKIAGEAFTLITGIDLERYELSIDPPKVIALVPNDENDDANTDLDEDENLPFPDVNKINHTWLHYRDRYKPETRYIMGIDVTENNPDTVSKLNNMLKQANQRQRASIALTLALLDPQSPFVNVKARSVL